MYSKYCSNIYCFSIQFVKSTCYILSRIEPCLFLVLHIYIVVLPFPDIPFMIHNVFKYSTFNLKFEDNMNQISNISITTITIFTNIFEQSCYKPDDKSWLWKGLGNVCSSIWKMIKTSAFWLLCRNKIKISSPSMIVSTLYTT
jgi:hypothetical protein